jgi:hypothetical protein
MAQLPKRWYRSKTVWFNALTVLTTLAAMHGWTPNDALMSDVTAAVLVLSPLVNIFLRFITRRPLIETL